MHSKEVLFWLWLSHVWNGCNANLQSTCLKPRHRKFSHAAKQTTISRKTNATVQKAWSHAEAREIEDFGNGVLLPSWYVINWTDAAQNTRQTMPRLCSQPDVSDVTWMQRELKRLFQPSQWIFSWLLFKIWAFLLHSNDICFFAVANISALAFWGAVSDRWFDLCELSLNNALTLRESNNSKFRSPLKECASTRHARQYTFLKGT